MYIHVYVHTWWGLTNSDPCIATCVYIHLILHVPLFSEECVTTLVTTQFTHLFYMSNTRLYMYAYKLLLYIDHSDQELPWGLDKSTGWTVFYEGLKTIPLHSVYLLHMYYMCLHSTRIQIVGPILWHTCPQRHIK